MDPYQLYYVYVLCYMDPYQLFCGYVTPTSVAKGLNLYLYLYLYTK
jgi:hypothetical protein